jgi:Ser/Thr protein kinase RdoA (MazF antagonist)
VLAGATQFPGRDDLWLAGTTVVRRHDRAAAATIEWIHEVLDALDFDAPKPVPYFDGASVAAVDGAVWGAVSYVDGDVVGWSTTPTMFELGAFLARFHDAVARVEIGRQQAPVFPVADLEGIGVALQEIGHADRPRHVIHGDFTNHNVLARDGRPRGVIDFANAYVEVPLADIGFALWRSGRPRQDCDEFDPERVATYIDGYSSVHPLTPDDRAAVLVYLRARGLQIIAKQAARGERDDGPRRKLAWLERNGNVLR